MTPTTHYPTMTTKVVFVIGLFVTAAMYHSAGMADGLAPTTVKTDSIAVAANEIISSICFTGALLAMLFPTRSDTPDADNGKEG